MELTRPMDGHPLCCRAFICQTIEYIPPRLLGQLATNQPTNQPLHQPSSSAAILWFMMESKQMPEHRGFSFWNLEYDDGDDGLFMQIACGVFPLALMDNWTCEWVRG